MPTYLVKIKGEFVVTQAVSADNEDEAKQKAKEGLGETISTNPDGDQEILSIKAM